MDVVVADIILVEPLRGYLDNVIPIGQGRRAGGALYEVAAVAGLECLCFS